MDLQPSQSNYNEGDRLQTSENRLGFFSRMAVSNKIMQRIMRLDSNFSPYDVFRIGGIGRVINQMGLNQRRHHIIYKVSSGEFAIPMELTGNVIEMQLIPKKEILEELSKLGEEVATTMKWIHIGTIEDFKRKDLMKEGNRPYSITYRKAYALSNAHNSDLFLRKEYIEIPRIFKEFAKVMTPDPIKIPRIGGVDIVIKDHPVLERTLSTQTEFSSRMSFLEDRITGYRGKENELIKIFTPQEIRVDNQPVIGRYEGMLEIAGHEILVAGRDFSQKILILNKGIREAKIMIGEALGTPWQQGLIDSDSFYEKSEEEIKNLKEALQEIKSLDISEESKLSLENVKRLIQRNFSENPLAWWDRNKIEATLKVKEECKYEYVRYKPIQMNMEDKKDVQGIIKEHINLGLIEPGVSAYSSPGFLKATIAVNKIEFLGILIDETGIESQDHIVEKIRNFPDVLKDKKHLQSFLGVVNFAGIFIKDLVKYRQDFRPLLKETESGEPHSKGS
ncbi:UNVERIFIED_CONTAM: movement protein [Sesamum latifolium]|uniref:Movement protein n=1 Tax=Sesamum latifolium TaxID=2727402 RepID=A0AAW2XCA3_9LAMI